MTRVGTVGTSLSRDDLEKQEGFSVTRIGTVGTSLSTDDLEKGEDFLWTTTCTVCTSSSKDDLEKREGFLATAVGTVGTSSSTNCTYGLSDEKREEDSISWTRYWYQRLRSEKAFSRDRGVPRKEKTRSLIGIVTVLVSIPGGCCLTSPLTKCDPT